MKGIRAARMACFDVVATLPSPDGTWREQARACLENLEDRLLDSGRELGDVLALTLFIDATENATCTDHRRRLVAQVRDFFCGTPPPTGVVAQAPAGGVRVALEATVLNAAVDDAYAVSRRAVRGTRYTVVTGAGCRQLHCAGIVSDPALHDRGAQSRDAFAKMAAVLDAERMTFGHVVRQWGTIEGVLALDEGAATHQGYQAFNDVRTLAYAASEFPAGYPAATGIGQAAGGIVLDFLALDAPPSVSVQPLSNPRQTDAHRYSRGLLVGEPLDAVALKCRPKFERAKRVVAGPEEIVFVSGTAAIVGERSVAPGDVAAQTETTIDNIAALVGGRRLSYLRAYVKRPGEIETVRRICEAAFGPVPATYVTADVCRDELLVEIEGALARRTESRRSPCEEPRSWPRS